MKRLIKKYFWRLLNFVLFGGCIFSLYQMVSVDNSPRTLSEAIQPILIYIYYCFFYSVWIVGMRVFKSDRTKNINKKESKFKEYLLNPSKSLTRSSVFYPEELKGGNGSFPKYTQRKYFIALCLMYPNLGGTLQEIQAVGLGQQPELSDNCKGYIQGFMQALIDARAWHFDSLVQMDAFVQQLLTDTDILKSFVKDFKNDIEETIELTLNPSADHL